MSPRTVRFPASVADGVRCLLFVCLAGLIGYAYGVQHVEDVMSCYGWLTGHWRNVSNYTHGPLIPLIAVGLVAMKWSDLKRVTPQPVDHGAWIVAAAMVIFYFGVKAVQPRLVVFSFVILLYGLVLALSGRPLMRVVFFPITFLLLMIPLNFLDGVIGFPLQILMAKIAAFVLNATGIEATRIGTGIRSAVYSFDVANPCSGIRSLMALTTVTAAFAYVTQRSQWKRWALFLSAIPLAVLGNVCRVVGVALVGQVYGPEVATKLHDTAAGFIVYGVALVAMVAFGFLLNAPVRRVLDQWLQPVAPATVTGGNS